MLGQPFRAEIGPYSLLLPASASVSAVVTGLEPGAVQVVFTRWTIVLGRFQIFAHLDASQKPGDLKWFIDGQTKGDMFTSSVSVNDIRGVRHGDYGPERTWIDWWFKRGDTMICLCLQSIVVPVTEPSDEELAEHDRIIGSLRFTPDFTSECPPRASARFL